MRGCGLHCAGAGSIAGAGAGACGDWVWVYWGVGGKEQVGCNTPDRSGCSTGTELLLGFAL